MDMSRIWATGASSPPRCATLHRHRNGLNGLGRMSILDLHHGHRRLLFGTCQIRIAQSPHCLACWHGHSTCRSTPVSASNRCRQMPQSRWSPDITRTGNGKSPPSPTATADSARRRSTSASPSPRASPSARSSSSPRTPTPRFGFVSFSSSATAAGVPPDAAKAHLRSSSAPSSVRAAFSRRGGASSRDGSSRRRRFAFNRKNPPSKPTLRLSAPASFGALRSLFVASPARRNGPRPSLL